MEGWGKSACSAGACSRESGLDGDSEQPELLADADGSEVEDDSIRGLWWLQATPGCTG